MKLCKKKKNSEVNNFAALFVDSFPNWVHEATKQDETRIGESRLSFRVRVRHESPARPRFEDASVRIGTCRTSLFHEKAHFQHYTKATSLSS